MEDKRGGHKYLARLEDGGSSLRQRFARDLFNGIASSYDLWAQALCLFQYLRWRRVLVSKVDSKPGALVLDVSTGTAGVAMEAAEERHAQVVGLDISLKMLRSGLAAVRKRSMDGQVQLVGGTADSLPFSSEAFDVVVFSYLLRYVPDPQATLAEMARVLKPGGQMLSLEFGVPESAFVRLLWHVYTGAVLPAATIPLSPGWRRVGRFLGRSIRDFYKLYPPEHIAAMWKKAGMSDVRAQRLSLGGGIVMWGTKEG
ncbi:MAG: class I SAM-dependent methyltransferase [Chloroflexi bacterium]|nr:class I SAM-dependent methyltransferase [Chloroflexota bacterium]